MKPGHPVSKLLMLLVAAFGTSATMAQDADFLRNLPSAREITSQFAGGSNAIQSLGRQCAALDRLERALFRSNAIMIPEVARHPATQAAQRDFSATFVRLREEYAAAVGGMDDAKQRAWSAMCQGGGEGALDRPVSVAEALAALPASVRQTYDTLRERSDQQLADRSARQAEATQAATQRAARQAQVDAVVAAEDAADERKIRAGGFAALIGGVLLALFCGRAGYRLRRYEFENRTDGGVVEFKSFGAANLHGFKKQLSFVGFLAGVIAAIVGALLVK